MCCNSRICSLPHTVNVNTPGTNDGTVTVVVIVPFVVICIAVVITVAVAMIAAYCLLKYRKNKEGKCNLAALMRSKWLGRGAGIRQRYKKRSHYVVSPNNMSLHVLMSA